jgi:hypothetical protein
MLLGVIATIAAPATATPVKKQPKVFTKGTTQMHGGYGQFGQTYTLNDNGSLVNFTLVSAEYTIDPYNAHTGAVDTANVDQKLLVIHYRIKNPNTGDLYRSAGTFFQVVDSNNNTIDDTGDVRRESEKDSLGITLKPGQGVDDLIDCAVLPAHGAMAKIIIKLGEAGTSDQVFRYNLGTAPNIVKPLAAPYVDTSDKSGYTALSAIPGVIGTAYNAGVCTMSVDNIALAPGPIGDHTADDGKQFLVATVTLTNPTWTDWYHSDNKVLPTLKTDDDKITEYYVVKAKHDENYEGLSLANGETTSERLLIPVPKDATMKTLSVLYDMGNNGLSRSFVYDVSGVK